MGLMAWERLYVYNTTTTAAAAAAAAAATTTTTTTTITYTTTSVVVAGGWGAWSTWQACSTSCGDGISARHRQCDSPVPRHGGRECVGSDADTKPCQLALCEGKRAASYMISFDSVKGCSCAGTQRDTVTIFSKEGMCFALFCLLFY